MACTACKLVLPVKHDMTGVTEELENESFIGDQDRGVTDDEDMEESPRGHGGGGHGVGEAYRGAIAWAKYGRYYYQGQVVDVDNIPDSMRKKLLTTAEKYIMQRTIILQSRNRKLNCCSEIGLTKLEQNNHRVSRSFTI